MSLLLRLTVTVAILGYLGSGIEWDELAHRLQRSDAGLLVVASLLVGVTYVIGSVRWWLLLRVQEIILPLKTVLGITLIGQFFNAYLLGSVGGDAVRAMYLWRLAPTQKTHATLAIVMDRALGLFVLLCFALTTLPWHYEELMASDHARAVAYGLTGAFATLLVAAATLMLIPFRRLPASWRRLWRKLPAHHVPELLVGGFRRHRRDLRLTLWALVCSILIYLIVFLAGCYLGDAIGVRMTYLQALTILSVVVCVISLPISIGGHGVREGAFVLLFAAFGILNMDRQTGGGYETAVLYSLLFFSLFLVWSLVGGLVYMVFRIGPERPTLSENPIRAS